MMWLNELVMSFFFFQIPSVEDGTEKLLDLSPFDLKHLLLLIFSSKEFTVDESKTRVVITFV